MDQTTRYNGIDLGRSELGRHAPSHGALAYAASHSLAPDHGSSNHRPTHDGAPHDAMPLEELLTTHIAGRFKRLTGLTVQTSLVESKLTSSPVGASEAQIEKDAGVPSNGVPSNGVPSNGVPSNGVPSNGVPSNGVPSNGVASNGATFDGASANGACSLWTTCLEQNAEHPGPQSHRCVQDDWCVIIPVTWEQRCVAACRLVCPGSWTSEAIEQHTELLSLVVENFVSKYGERLAIPAAELELYDAAASNRPLHPQVRAAIDYIAKHAKDPDMTVARVAQDLEVNATYLAHLYSKQLGMRMGRAIAEQRIQIAKTLLSETDWQIKRIAFESGHRNPDWFSEVFRSHTGSTPSAFRRKAGRFRSKRSR